MNLHTAAVQSGAPVIQDRGVWTVQAAPLTGEVLGGEQGVERVECVGNSFSDELKIG